MLLEAGWLVGWLANGKHKLACNFCFWIASASRFLYDLYFFGIHAVKIRKSKGVIY
jgi:hypothetical protein